MVVRLPIDDSLVVQVDESHSNLRSVKAEEELFKKEFV